MLVRVDAPASQTYFWGTVIDREVKSDTKLNKNFVPRRITEKKKMQ